MDGINDNEPERSLTATDAFALFKRLQIEEQAQKDEGFQGSELPLEISEYLDGTPTYELKEEFKRFKRQVARYNNDTWNRQEQINKEFIPEPKKWKIDAFRIVNTIYRYSENTRVQARASTEIYEQLQCLQKKTQFDNEEDKRIFEGAVDQAVKLNNLPDFDHLKFFEHVTGHSKRKATGASRIIIQSWIEDDQLKKKLQVNYDNWKRSNESKLYWKSRNISTGIYEQKARWYYKFSW